MSQARLTYWDPKGLVVERLVPAAGLTIGRAASCEIRFEDPRISLRHAVIRPADGAYSVEDQGSTNGTLVNGQRLRGAARLRHMDLVVCGPLQILFCLVADAEHPTLPGAAPRTEGSTDTEQLRALCAEVQELREQGDGLEDLIRQTELMRSAAERENGSLRRELEEARRQSAALRRQLEEEQGAHRGAVEGIGAVRTEAELAQAQLQRLRERVHKLTAERDGQSAAAKQLEAELKQLRAQHEQQRQEGERLVRDRDLALGAANEAQQRLVELSCVQQNLERQRQETSQELAALAGQLRYVEEERARGESQLRELRATLSARKEQLEERDRQLRTLRRDLDVLIAETERQKKRMQEDLRRLSDENSQLRQKIWTLEAALTARAALAGDGPLAVRIVQK